MCNIKLNRTKHFSMKLFQLKNFFLPVSFIEHVWECVWAIGYLQINMLSAYFFCFSSLEWLKEWNRVMMRHWRVRWCAWYEILLNRLWSRKSFNYFIVLAMPRLKLIKSICCGCSPFEWPKLMLERSTISCDKLDSVVMEFGIIISILISAVFVWDIAAKWNRKWW